MQSIDTDEDAHPADIEFLAFEDICAIHDRGLAEFGFGMPGFVDEHSVRSATAQPQAAVFGKYLHDFPAGMSAAYLYYLTKQQGFINGNKRTAVGAALEFLARNGYRLDASSYDIYQLTIRVDVKSEPRLALAEIAQWIEERLAPME